jgi:hypothetical protein
MKGSNRQSCCLGELDYHIFDSSDFDRVWNQYIRHSPMVDLWAKADFTKPGLEKQKTHRNKWIPQIRDFYVHGNSISVFATFESDVHLEFGAPELVTMEWNFEPREIRLNLQLFNKPVCRIPEAMWLTMHPGLGKNIRCWMDKLGEWVDPLDVVSRGNRALHALGEGVEYVDNRGKIKLHSFDVPLMAPGDLPLMDFTDAIPNLSKGPNFNLFNNLWGTNFPMWFEGDLKFRFELIFE